MTDTTLKKAGIVAGAVAATAAAFTAVFYFREKATEKPNYSLIASDDAIEIRDYPDLTVAETEGHGERDDALKSGFRKLAAYIFAKARGASGGGEKIAMTAPVLQDRTTRGTWRTRFVMPAGRATASLPQPGSNVTTAALGARRVAVIRFAGSASDDALYDQERMLRAWLLARARTPNGPVEFAFYNSPFVPAPLRRNEVIIPIAP